MGAAFNSGLNIQGGAGSNSGQNQQQSPGPQQGFGMPAGGYGGGKFGGGAGVALNPQPIVSGFGNILGNTLGQAVQNQQQNPGVSMGMPVEQQSPQDQYTQYANNIFGGGDSIFKPNFNPTPAPTTAQQPDSNQMQNLARVVMPGGPLGRNPGDPGFQFGYNTTPTPAPQGPQNGPNFDSWFQQQLGGNDYNTWKVQNPGKDVFSANKDWRAQYPGASELPPYVTAWSGIPVQQAAPQGPQPGFGMPPSGGYNSPVRTQLPQSPAPVAQPVNRFAPPNAPGVGQQPRSAPRAANPYLRTRAPRTR